MKHFLEISQLPTLQIESLLEQALSFKNQKKITVNMNQTPA